MDDRTKAGLRGPVSVCRTDTTLFVRDCGGNTCNPEPKEQRHWAVAHYHLHGRMAQYHHHNSNGAEWISTYTYDANGLLQEIETRDAVGSVSKSIYLYDRSGCLQHVVTRLADGAENRAQTFSYDGQRKTKTRHLNSTSRSADSAVAYTIEGSDAAFSVPGAALMTTVYDNQDRPVETLFQDSKRRGLSRVTLRYDDAGRVVEETQTTETEATLPPDMLAQLNPAQLQSLKIILGVGQGGQQWKRTHRYDAEGHRVESVIRLGALGGSWKTMAYNEHGDLTEEKSAHDSREFSVDVQGHMVQPSEPPSRKTPITEARFSYQYDDQGNWIERVISSRPEAEKPPAVSSVDRRSLTYYPAV
jgi:YD repeat-containing protein